LLFKDLNVSLDTNEKIISNVISATNKISPRMDEICQTKNIDQIPKYNAIEDILNNALETTIDSNFQDIYYFVDFGIIGKNFFHNSHRIIATCHLAYRYTTHSHTYILALRYDRVS